MDKLLQSVRDFVRYYARRLARAVNGVSHGRITPNQITFFGLTMHLPISLLIIRGQYIFAAILLVIFGLFDTLDGELARLQKSDGPKGMLLDATTDRMKEVALFSAICYSFVHSNLYYQTVWCVLACGGSLLVSYVKSKGETAIKDASLSPNQINRLFQDGLMRFEVRMTVLVIGLLLNQLVWAVAIIAVSSWLTAFGRLVRITQMLS